MINKNVVLEQVALKLNLLNALREIVLNLFNNVTLSLVALSIIHTNVPMEIADKKNLNVLHLSLVL